MTRRVLAAAVAASVAGSVLALLAAPSAVADTTKTLPLGGVNDIVVDAAQGKVFISGWTNNFINDGSTGGIVVANVDGSGIARLPGVGDTNGLVLGPDGDVYAAESDGHILQISPSTLAVTSFSTGAAGCPNSVAFAGTELWFSYGCTPSSDAGLAELDTGDGTVTSGVLAGSKQGVPLLAGVPGQSELLATNISTSGHDLNLISVSGLTATVGPSLSNVTVNDIDVSPDGSTALVANGVNGVTYNVADLSAGARTFTTPAGSANSVAYSPDGSYVAVGAGGVGNPDTITTFGPDSTDPVRTYDTSTPGSANVGQNTIPAARGLAWSGHTLLGLYVDYGRAYPILKVLTSATQAVSTMTLTGPSSSPRAKTLTLSGTLAVGGTGLAGVQVTVKKAGLDGTHTLASVTTSGTGAFTVHDTPAVGGTNTYTVSYAGDATHAPVSRSAKVTVSRLTPALTLSTNHSLYSYAQRQYITAHLGTTYRNRTVTVLAREYGTTTWRTLRTAKVDSHGNLATSVVARRNVSIRASFSGDERYASRTVTVSRHVRAALSTRIYGSYAKSGSYHLFRYRDGGELVVHILPVKPGEAVHFTMQHRVNGGWRTGASDTEYLNADSYAAVVFDGARNIQFRIRATFSGDSVNSSVAGGWWYVEFR